MEPRIACPGALVPDITNSELVVAGAFHVEQNQTSKYFIPLAD
jgi:hypothetical protein